MSADAAVAVTLASVMAAGAAVLAVVTLVRRRPGSLGRRGPAVDYRIRAVCFGIVAVAFVLTAVAVARTNAGDGDGPAFGIAGSAVFGGAALVAFVGPFVTRRSD